MWSSWTSQLGGGGEAYRQIGIFRNQLFSTADQIEFLATDGEYCIRSDGERANAFQLLDKESAQLRVEIFRPCIEVIEAPAQLESDYRKPRLFADGRGLNQLIDNGSEAALCTLRRAVENDQCREIALGLHSSFGILLARLLERAADLHLHDLEPWRKQPLRLLTGLEYRLQKSSEALPSLEPQPY